MLDAVAGMKMRNMEQIDAWQLLSPDPAAVDLLASQLEIHPLLARIMVNRGVSEVAAARDFLRPKLTLMGDPFAMADAEVASIRLARAVVDKERVCIYGDYDVDGVSASSLLAQFLRSVGCEPRVFLPDRFTDGYGLNVDRVRELCAEGLDLFISVDCGSKAVEPITAAREAGCDFIVCDHHQLGLTHPPVTALMNPHRPDCGYPTSDLCAVGVALVLAQGTRRKLAELGHFAGQPPSLAPLLQYAALGTIADMVPLEGINRALAWHGLRHLGKSQSAGVKALAGRARLTGIGRADHVGFVLGPRINAAGRVADAKTAFELLTTTDSARAEELAGQIEIQNNRRRALQKEVTAEALAAAADLEGREHAVVLADPRWHSGVVGIVAARVKEQFAVPTFILTIEDGVAKGSGRSVEGYDLVAGLHKLAEDGLFRRFGGHYFAAGVTMDAAKVPQFRAALAKHVAEVLPISARRRTISIDAEVQLADLSLETADILDALEPHGRGNSRPKFLLRGVVIAEKRIIGADKNWVRLKLVEDNDRPLWARRGRGVFCARDRVEHLEDGDVVSAIVQLERNHFQGRTTPQLKPLAFGPAEPQIEHVANR